jgi:hypothetical protein
MGTVTVALRTLAQEAARVQAEPGSREIARELADRHCAVCGGEWRVEVGRRPERPETGHTRSCPVRSAPDWRRPPRLPRPQWQPPQPPPPVQLPPAATPAERREQRRQLARELRARGWKWADVAGALGLQRASSAQNLAR